jgi:DNA invertase Pin-like site-specific DNA recombinase
MQKSVEFRSPQTRIKLAFQTLEHCGLDMYFDQQALDTTTPAGKLMFQVTGAFAEFERSMIKQRINAGLKRAIDQGKQLGRPRISPEVEKQIQDLLRAKKGMLAIAKEVGVGSGTVQRIAREMAGGGAPFDLVSAVT